MRIAVIALGSRGDVEPYMALGKGLQKAGHEIRLVTHQDFDAAAKSHGLECWPIEGSVQDVAQSAEMRRLLEKGNFLAVFRRWRKKPLWPCPDGLAACQGMEMVLTGIGGLFAGLSLAEKLHLPLLQAYYIPFTPTRAYPSFLFPKLPSWFGGAEPLSYYLAPRCQGFRRPIRLSKVLGCLLGSSYRDRHPAPEPNSLWFQPIRHPAGG